jgi:hypothetical protein
MTAEGWRELVLDAAGDPTSLDLLARLLEEQDRAKQILRDKGYGCTGMGWLQTVDLVPERA